jgi:hypothetical protein
MSETHDASRRATPISEPAAKLALGAGVGFFVTFAFAHVAKPDLDPSWQPISMYAIGTHGWVMTLAFLLWGLSPIGLFVALRPRLRTWGGRVGLAFLFIGGSGPILAAVFPTDSISAGTMTLTGRLHEIGAVLGDGIPIATADSSQYGKILIRRKSRKSQTGNGCDASNEKDRHRGSGESVSGK